MDLVWDMDPVLLEIGFFELRYYGVFFAISLAAGVVLIVRRLQKKGLSVNSALDFILMGLLFIVLGTRLFHCFFYEPGYFLSHPVEILKLWQGGLASHGAIVGLLLAAWIFSKWKNVPLYLVTDSVALGGFLPAMAVRLGNFFNSEMVGRATEMPWGVRFMRFSDHGSIARHPAQIYEALGILIIGLGLMWLDKKVGQSRHGSITSTFILSYAVFRFSAEFFKEYQVLHSFLTMGQWLSLPLIGLGWFLMKQHRSADKGHS